jgi:hypothetical protein
MSFQVEELGAAVVLVMADAFSSALVHPIHEPQRMSDPETACVPMNVLLMDS